MIPVGTRVRLTGGPLHRYMPRAVGTVELTASPILNGHDLLVRWDVGTYGGMAPSSCVLESDVEVVEP